MKPIGLIGLIGLIGFIGLISTVSAFNGPTAAPPSTNAGQSLFATSSKVGIGTSTPTEKLEVVGNIKASGSFIGTISGTMSATNITGPAAFGINVGTYNYAFPGALAVGTTTTTGLPTEGFYVKGSVGIGASPQNKLNIDTTTDNDGLSVRKSGVLMGRIVQNGATGAGRLDLYSGGTNTIQLAANATSYFNSGNVGIGTTTPSNIFEVVGASKNVVFRGDGLTDDARFEFNNFGGSGGNRRLVFSASSPSIQSLFTNTGGVASLHLQPSGGNVGIGTTSPQHKLSVAGAFYSVQVNKGNCTGAVTIDWNDGNTQHCTLTGNVTFTFNNGQAGGNYRLILKQDATGSRIVTWPSSVRWADGIAPTLTTTANKTDYVGFIYNGVDAKYDGVAFNANF